MDRFSTHRRDLRLSAIARQFGHQLPKALGMGYMEGMKFHAAVEPAIAEALDAALARGRPWLLAAIGYGGVLVIAWLIRFEPF